MPLSLKVRGVIVRNSLEVRTLVDERFTCREVLFSEIGNKLNQWILGQMNPSPSSQQLTGALANSGQSHMLTEMFLNGVKNVKLVLYVSVPASEFNPRWGMFCDYLDAARCCKVQCTLMGNQLQLELADLRAVHDLWTAMFAVRATILGISYEDLTTVPISMSLLKDSQLFYQSGEDNLRVLNSLAVPTKGDVVTVYPNRLSMLLQGYGPLTERDRRQVAPSLGQFNYDYVNAIAARIGLT